MATTKQTKVLTSAIGVDDNERVYTSFTDGDASDPAAGVLAGQMTWMVLEGSDKLVARVVYSDGTEKKCVLSLLAL